MTGSSQNDKGSLMKVYGSEDHLCDFQADGLHTWNLEVTVYNLASQVEDPFQNQPDALET